NLGSINLSKFISNGQVSWKRLAKTVHDSVRFLDDVIEVNRYPLKKIEDLTRSNRKIGLGVMGFADMLIQLNIKYDSDEAIKFAEKLMGFVRKESRKASQKIADKRGSFKNFRNSALKKDFKRMRNAQLTTIAPTGSISIIANCSSGIEPLFGLSFVRNILDGVQLRESNAAFERIAKEKGFFSKELMMKIAKTGSIRQMKEIPIEIRKVFVTSHDISPEWHIRLQATFQRYTDSAVSKTINLPANASRADVAKAYLLAWKLKCKGITVYRYGTKKDQVLVRKECLHADSEFGGDCVGSECSF
ncbi:MAG: hypothetical protein ACE5DM_01285, partial [Candidatus Nanoarchaeia archaeon]